MDLTQQRILVTGGNGFLGSWIIKMLKKRGVLTSQIFAPRSRQLDLTKRDHSHEATKGVNLVIHAAGLVGGIGLNQKMPGRMFYDNLIMGAELIEASRKARVKKMVVLGTVCAYPRILPIPFREDDLWQGYPEETNAPYGLAKKALLVQLQAFRQEFGFNGIYLLPVNLYGPQDHFEPERSHVIPALIVKIDQAKKENRPFIEVWGTGQASREFLYVEEAAEAILLAAEHYDKPEPVNLGSGMEITIKNLVELLCRLMDYKGRIVWDKTKPDGQPRRCLDTTRAANEFGFKARVNFEEGLKRTIQWYYEHKARV